MTSVEQIFDFRANPTTTVKTGFPPCISDEPFYSSRPAPKKIDNKVVIPRLRGNADGIKPASQRLGIPVKITLELIAALHGLPLPRAASAVGISATAFKRACRSLGVGRWDYKRGRGQRQQRGVANADEDAIAQEGPEPIPFHSNMAPLGSCRDLPARCPTVTPAWLPFKSLLPQQSGAISFAENESDWSELAARTFVPIAPPPAPPKPAHLDLGWPVLCGEMEGWAEGEALWGTADDALVRAMLDYPWPAGGI
jgi:hypothetical protein